MDKKECTDELCRKKVFELVEDVTTLKTDYKNLKKDVDDVIHIEKRVTTVEQDIDTIKKTTESLESITHESVKEIQGIKTELKDISLKFDQFRLDIKKEVVDTMEGFLLKNWSFRKTFISILAGVIVIALVGWAGYFIDSNIKTNRLEYKIKKINDVTDSLRSLHKIQSKE
jgi:hypothetical protein